MPAKAKTKRKKAKRLISKDQVKRSCGRQWTPLLTTALAEAIRSYIVDHCPTITKLCEVFNINRCTFYRWIAEHKDLKEAIEAAKVEGLQRLSDKARVSLEKLVEGYKFTEVTRERYKGKLQVTKRVRKYVQPAEKSVHFVLQNTDPETWKDRREIEHTGHVPIKIINYADAQTTSGDNPTVQLHPKALPAPAAASDGQRVPAGGGGVAPTGGEGQDLG